MHEVRESRHLVSRQTKIELRRCFPAESQARPQGGHELHREGWRECAGVGAGVMRKTRTIADW